MAKILNTSAVNSTPTLVLCDNGEEKIVAKWPESLKSVEWLRALCEMGKAAIPDRASEAAFTNKYMQLINPHPQKDYAVLRSKGRIPKSGGTPCPTAYTYEHMIVVEDKHGSEIGSLTSATVVEHARFGELHEVSRTNHKGSNLKKRSKTIMNTFIGVTTPDGEDMQVPVYSTTAASYEAHYRAQTFPKNKAYTHEEMREMAPRAGVLKGAFAEALAQPNEFVREDDGENAGTSAAPPKSKKAATEPKEKPSSAPASASRSKKKEGGGAKNTGYDAFVRAVRKKGEDRLRATHDEETVRHLKSMESVFEAVGMAADTDLADIGKALEEWTRAETSAAAAAGEARKTILESVNAAEKGKMKKMLNTLAEQQRVMFYQMAFLHFSMLA